MIVEVPVSVGELIDKIVILGIKVEHFADPDKRQNAARELAALEARCRSVVGEIEGLEPLRQGLHDVNRQLWTVEDEIRACERDGEFGDRFVALARSVYRLNDERFRLKQQINGLTGSELVEEKGYERY